MSRFIKKRCTRRSRLWLAVFAIMSMGFVPFGMCDDNGGDFDCGDSDCDTDCNTDNDGDCDCEHHKDNSDENFWDTLEEARQQQYKYESEFAYTYSEEKKGNIAETAQRKRPADELKSKLRKKRIIAFLFKRKKIQVGFASSYLAKLEAPKVYQMLNEQAFSQIKLVPILDIGPKSRTRVGKVKEVTIGEQSVFVKTDKFAYDTPVTIYYHDKIAVTVPWSAKSLRKRNCEDVYADLQELGFTRIYKCPKRDVVVGWFSKEGEVESVSIAGNDRFKKASTYKFDVEITINYHTSITTKRY